MSIPTTPMPIIATVMMNYDEQGAEIKPATPSGLDHWPILGDAIDELSGWWLHWRGERAQ